MRLLFSLLSLLSPLDRFQREVVLQRCFYCELMLAIK